MLVRRDLCQAPPFWTLQFAMKSYNLGEIVGEGFKVFIHQWKTYDDCEVVVGDVDDSVIDNCS